MSDRTKQPAGARLPHEPLPSPAVGRPLTGFRDREPLVRDGKTAWEAGKLPPGWKEFHKYRHPGDMKVRLTLFWTNLTETDPAPRMVRQARRMLGDHGLGLDVYPFDSKKPNDPHTLVYPYEVNTRTNVQELRDLCHKAFDDQKTEGKKQRLPVIFCNYRMQGTHTIGQTFKPENWLPFSLINVRIPSKDGLTLLHEVGHAAGLERECHKYQSAKDDIQNIMHWGAPNRTDMNKRQVLAIAAAYFCK